MQFFDEFIRTLVLVILDGVEVLVKHSSELSSSSPIPLLPEEETGKCFSDHDIGITKNMSFFSRTR